MVRTYKRRYRGSGGRARARAVSRRRGRRAAGYALARRRPVRARNVRMRAFTPQRKYARLKYVDAITLDPAARVLASHNFSCNGLYDPDQTGTGHQPLGFDQYMQFYDHYTVVGAKITIKGQSEQTSVGEIVGIYKNDDTSFLPTLAGHACELPGTKYKYLAEKDNGEMSTFTLTSKWSHKELPILHALGSNEIRGTASSNPSEQTYWTIFIGPNASSVDDLNAHVVHVHIEYLVVFTEPKEIGQS